MKSRQYQAPANGIFAVGRSGSKATMHGTLRTHETAKRQAGSFWIARRSPFRKTLLFSVLFIRHLRALMPLLLAPRGSNLRKLIKARFAIFGIVLTHYVAASWDTRTRVARLVDHYKTVAEIGGVLDFPADNIVDIMRLVPIDLRYRITLDQADWLMADGSLIMSLWDGVDRIFHLGFSLSTENGKRVAYIGSIQGRCAVDMYNYRIDILERYRRFSRAAAGMRPRDFLVEVFKMFCRTLDVVEIRAVSNLNHPQRKLVPDIKLSYDEIWIERGGSRGPAGFFILPVTASRRANENMPSKKRAVYAKRYRMLDSVEAELAAVLRSRSMDCAAQTAV